MALEQVPHYGVWRGAGRACACKQGGNGSAGQWEAHTRRRLHSGLVHTGAKGRQLKQRDILIFGMGLSGAGPRGLSGNCVEQHASKNTSVAL